MAPEPGGLRLGGVLGGFETEGGFGGPGQPADSWCWWEIEGRARPRPAAGGSWESRETQVAQVARAGFTSVRICVEWARCEPLDGEVDLHAVAGYCRVLDRCHEHGVAPVVVLHRFAHPAWMGVDFWLRPDAPERFSQWVDTAMEHFAGRAHQWVTIDQLNAAAVFSYLSGRHPPGRRLDVGATIRALDHLLAAHVLAYETIKDRQPHGVVAVGLRHLPAYEIDGLLVDVLLARGHGVGRHDLRGWLSDRRAAHDTASRDGGRLARALRRWTASAVPGEQALARTVAAVYDSAFDRPLDVLEISAEAGDAFRVVPLPGNGDRVAWWADRGGHVEAACRAAGRIGLPLAVVADAPTGVNRLRANQAEVETAIEAGAAVTAFHQRLRPDALARLAGRPAPSRAGDPR